MKTSSAMKEFYKFKKELEAAVKKVPNFHEKMKEYQATGHWPEEIEPKTPNEN